MFYLNRSSIRCLPSQIIVRTLKVSNKKKYIRQKSFPKGPSYAVHLQVVGSGAPDQMASVVLKTNNRQYLFNCGEGINSLSQNVGIALKKIDHAFFTQSKWNCIGGITSVIFSTIAYSGYPPTIHGPEILYNSFKRMSYLSIVGSLFKHRLTPEVFKTNERFEDSDLVIEPIQLKHLKETAFIYVCTLKACKGNFSILKSIEKNVPCHLIATLYKGEDITLDDGTVITAKEMQNPGYPELNIIFADVPNHGFLKDLGTNEKLKSLLAEIRTIGVEVIVHFTPSNVFQTQQYQQFIDFVNAKSNMLVNDMNKHSSMKSVYSLQEKLNKINSKIHPMLSTPLDAKPRIFDSKTEQDRQAPMFYTKYVLRDAPKEYLTLDQNDEEPESDDFDDILSVDTGHEASCSKNVPLKLKDERFPRILFLGTGASDSFHLRNSSGILVHLSPDHSILLDCGTGTCSQINRFYGKEASEIYRRIKAVYISHMHLDHHIGLPEILRWRELYLTNDREPLRIFCPLDDLKSWLLFYANHMHSIHADVKFIDNDILMEDKLTLRERLYLNVDSIKTCRVDHFRKSYGLAMNFSYRNGDKTDTFKLAYSGDMGLSDAFAKLGHKADLLIHEATFQDELEGLARKFRHSTCGMALEQSKNMEAKHTILTHFSSRYHIIPYFRQKLDENTGIAFDYMEITPDDLPRINSLYREYINTFQKQIKEHKQKTRSYMLQQGYDEELLE